MYALALCVGEEVVMGTTDDSGICVYTRPENQYYVKIFSVPDEYDSTDVGDRVDFAGENQEMTIVLRKIQPKRVWADNPEGIFYYFGENISRVKAELGSGYRDDYYEGGHCLIYEEFGAMFFFNEYDGSNVYAILVYRDEEYGYGLTGDMTYGEVAEAVTHLTFKKLKQPTGYYNQMDECYEYTVGFEAYGMNFSYLWDSDPYTNPSHHLYVY